MNMLVIISTLVECSLGHSWVNRQMPNNMVNVMIAETKGCAQNLGKRESFPKEEISKQKFKE